MPLIVDVNPPEVTLPELETYIIDAVRKTDLIAIIDSSKWEKIERDKYIQDLDSCLPHIAFHLNRDVPLPPEDIINRTRLVEIPDGPNSVKLNSELKKAYPGIVVSVRVAMNSKGVERAIELAASGVEVIHAVADVNGNEIGEEQPRFIKDMVRDIHLALIKEGQRDEVTLIAGSGIALPEHMAKAMICGADLVSTYLPFLISIECHLCGSCEAGRTCPAGIEGIDHDYAVDRMRNLVAAWHLQLIELMGAMGIREARRLRGDVGRAMFFEDLEEQNFGPLFGTRKQA